MRGLDDGLGWTNLFRSGLEIISAEGDHLSMFREHHQTLAQSINETLKRFDTSEGGRVGCLARERAGRMEEASVTAAEFDVPITNEVQEVSISRIGIRPSSRW